MKNPVLVLQRLDRLHTRPAGQRPQVVLLELGGCLRREDLLVRLAVEVRPAVRKALAAAALAYT